MISLPNRPVSTSSAGAEEDISHAKDKNEEGKAGVVYTTTDYEDNQDNLVEMMRNKNLDAVLKNPLSGIPRQKLFDQVADFCRSNGLEDKVALFQRAALVAQNPDKYEEVSELTEDERYWIARETTHKWSLPKQLWMLIFVVSLGSAIQGWDNTGANGANLSFPVEFGIDHNEWLVGFVNSAPTIAGLMSAWLCDPLNNMIGRRAVIFVTGLFTVFPVLAQAFTRNWWELAICRLLIGVGIGCKITTIPIMTAESVPAAIRGGLVMSFQVCATPCRRCGSLRRKDVGELTYLLT